MNIFPKTFTVPSEKNGLITVEQFLGCTKVWAGGFEQSGPYVTKLWRQALTHMPKNQKVADILIVGLGGGCSLRTIEKRYPDARITVVEWDRAMVDIALRLHLFTRMPEILVGDVCSVLPTLHIKFDLILSDAFFGGVPEPRLGEDSHTQSLAHVLAPSGRIILNAFKTPLLIPINGPYLHHEETWEFEYNQVVMFSRSTN